MKSLKYLILLLMWMSVQHVSGQEHARFSQYMHNKYEFNPAYAGINEQVDIYFQARSQWSNLDLNPKTYLFNIDMPITNINSGVGIKLMNDQIGYYEDNRMSLSYNYLYDTYIGMFSIGMGAGFRSVSIDGSQLRTIEGDYLNIINHKDGVIDSKSYTGQGMIWDIGMLYYNNSIEIGLSISNMSLNNITFDLYDSKTDQELRIFFQYKKRLTKYIVIKPMALIKTNYNELNLDISTVLDYYGRMFAGISIQTNNKINIPSFGITMGARLNRNVKIYYNYDFDFSPLKTINDGSHGLVLNYNLNKIIGNKRVVPVIYGPRTL